MKAKKGQKRSEPKVRKLSGQEMKKTDGLLNLIIEALLGRLYLAGEYDIRL